MLALLATALAAPRVSLLADGDSYQLTVRGERIDAWTFATHYDRGVRRGIVGNVYGRRLAFLGGLGVGAVTTVAGIVWLGNSLSRVGQDPSVAGPVGLVATGGVMFLATIPVAATVKQVSLQPHRYWTEEEALLLANGEDPGHGLQIVPTAAGWLVINRAGRPLNAVEVAGKIGDRGVLRRARASNAAANLAAGVTLGVGYASLLGGLGMATEKRGTPDTQMTGVGAMALGTTLIVGALIGRSAMKRRAPSSYWTREELQLLLDLP